MMRAVRTKRTRQIALYGGGLAVVVVAGIIVLSVLYVTDGAGTGMLRPDDSEMVTAGREIYADSCAGCHGADMKGQMVPSSKGANELVLAPPHDGSGHTWRHPDEVLFDLTKYGASGIICIEPADRDMPVFEEDLLDEQIVAVLSFIKSTWPEEIREQHNLVNELFSTAE
jgi:mono/diheme cytochrome c family protein